MKVLVYRNTYWTTLWWQKRGQLRWFLYCPFHTNPLPTDAHHNHQFTSKSSTSLLPIQILHVLFGPFNVLPSFMKASRTPPLHSVTKYFAFSESPRYQRKQNHHDTIMTDIIYGLGLVFCCLYSFIYSNIDKFKKHKTQF